jgi:CheY-like chemotaxis protein
MTESLKALQSTLAKKINILVVDDEQSITESLKELLNAPLINVVTANSFVHAADAIRSLQANWHTWILDIDLGSGKSGLDIIKAHEFFPFIVVLSGLGSMNMATEALRLGARRAFDKNPDSLSMIYEEVSRWTTLGFILRGRATKYLKVFSLLSDPQIRSAQDWADQACITVRQLSRICELHGSITARHYIAFYNAVYALLLVSGEEQSNNATGSAEQSYKAFRCECMDFSARYIDEIGSLLIK